MKQKPVEGQLDTSSDKTPVNGDTVFRVIIVFFFVIGIITAPPVIMVMGDEIPVIGFVRGVALAIHSTPRDVQSQVTAIEKGKTNNSPNVVIV